MGEQRGDQLVVLVQMYGDRSGIPNVFGPYVDEGEASAAEADLRTLGLDGLFEIHALRRIEIR